MKDHPLRVEQIRIGFSARFQVEDNAQTFDVSAGHEFLFRRLHLSDLTTAERKTVVCAGGSITLPEGTFMLLLPSSGCCRHGRLDLRMGPSPTPVVGRLTGPEIDEEVTATCAYTLSPVRDRRSWRRFNLFDHYTDPATIAPVLNIISPGKAPSAIDPEGRDAELTVTWPFGDATSRTLVATYRWRGVTETDVIDWTFAFNATALEFAHTTPTVTGSIVSSTAGLTAADLAAEIPLRFQLSAEPDGGRVAFIGVYGSQRLEIGNSFDLVSSSGTARTGTFGPDDSDDLETFASVLEARSFPSVTVLGIGIDPGPRGIAHGDTAPDNWSGAADWDTTEDGQSGRIYVAWGV